MAFNSGPINVALPGATLYSALETMLLSVGYVLVDTVTIGSTVHKVLFSAAAGNSAGKDWYIDISYSTSAVGILLMSPFENYNSTTHVGTNGPTTSASTIVDQTSWTRYGSTPSALETNWQNTQSWSGQGAILSTSFTYFANVTRDGVALMTTADPTFLSYAGFYTPTAQHASASGAALFPLIRVKLLAPTVVTSASISTTGAGTTGATLNRVPKVPTGSWFDWSTSVIVATGLLLGFTGGLIGGTGVSPIVNEMSIATGIPIYAGSNSLVPNPSTFASALIGYIPPLIGVGMGGAGVAMGNTITIGTDTWYLTNLNGAGFLALKGS